MLLSLHGKGKTPLMLLYWVITTFRLFVSSLNQLIESMASLKGRIGLQIVGSSKDSLSPISFIFAIVIPDYAKFMLVVRLWYTITN